MVNEIKQLTANLIKMLVSKRYFEIEVLTSGVRLNAKDIQKTIKEYRRTLVQPPPDAFDLINIIKVETQAFEQYSVQMPLWTKEEQRSDLTLEFSVKFIEKQMLVKLQNIHVL